MWNAKGAPEHKEKPGYSLHPRRSPDITMSSCHWILTFKDETGIILVQRLINYNIIHAHVTMNTSPTNLHTIHLTSNSSLTKSYHLHPLIYAWFIRPSSHSSPNNLKPCSNVGRAKQQVEVTTGSCSFDPAHRWPQTLVVHPYIRGSRGVQQHPWRLISPLKDWPSWCHNYRLIQEQRHRTDCGNHRGISLLSIAGKILACIMLNSLIPSVAEKTLPESKCEFHRSHSTTNMIFTVTYPSHRFKRNALNRTIMCFNTVFIDLTKAFNMDNREALWVILRKPGCPAKFTTLIRLLHDDMTGEVLSDGKSSERFDILNGVKQGCVLAWFLFNLYFSCR